MPRRMFHDGADDAYRVIINSVGQATDTEYHEAFGPYGTLGAAKGVLTNELGQGYRQEATGHVERAVTVWVVVE